MTQEEIVSNTKIVLQGLEALRVEHLSIVNSLVEGKKDPDKYDIVQKNINNIELGIGEAQVIHFPFFGKFKLHLNGFYIEISNFDFR